MKKCYVIDTNVLLSDPNALYSFGDNEVIIPSVVLEELDSKKKLMDELGRNARYTARLLDELRENGALHTGVDLHNGGTLKVVTHPHNSIVFSEFLDNKNDNAIIAVAKAQSEINPDTILVSKDVLVRVKSDIVSVKAEDYRHDKVASAEEDLYKGYTEVTVDDKLIDDFYRNQFIELDERFADYPENHFFILRSGNFENKKGIARKFDGKLNILSFYKRDMEVFGLSHKNIEQQMALELLLDDSVPLVTLSGKAGTGKTLIALAAALHKTLDEQRFRKVLVARPVIPMGKDIGYLPGTKDEKLRFWMQPIYDNLEYLFDCNDELELSKTLSGYEDIITIEALTYIRGRSIPDQWIIIDEAQNLSQHEAKTIVTRIGSNSKLVMIGDTEQIDSPYLDTYSNGLSYIIEKMKNEDIVGHVTLTKGERSDLAQRAADLL